MTEKKFSWFSVVLSTGCAAPVCIFVAWCFGVLDAEMIVAQTGTVFATCVIMERLWPTVTRADKE